MEKERRTFDKEFKLMAVELSRARENIPQLALELGIRADLIYRWRKEFKNKGEVSFSGKGKTILTAEEAEIARLKKELREAELERDILKKAVSIFSKRDGKYSDL